MSSINIILYSGKFADTDGLVEKLSDEFSVTLANNSVDHQQAIDINARVVLIDLSRENFDALGTCIDIVGDTDLDAKLVCFGEPNITQFDLQNISTLAHLILEPGSDSKSIVSKLRKFLAC